MDDIPPMAEVLGVMKDFEVEPVATDSTETSRGISLKQIATHESRFVMVSLRHFSVRVWIKGSE